MKSGFSGFCLVEKEARALCLSFSRYSLTIFEVGSYWGFDAEALIDRRVSRGIGVRVLFPQLGQVVRLSLPLCFHS